MRDAGVADLASAGLDRLEAAWQEVKAEEKRAALMPFSVVMPALEAWHPRLGTRKENDVDAKRTYRRH